MGGVPHATGKELEQGGLCAERAITVLNNEGIDPLLQRLREIYPQRAYEIEAECWRIYQEERDAWGH